MHKFVRKLGAIFQQQNLMTLPFRFWFKSPTGALALSDPARGHSSLRHRTGTFLPRDATYSAVYDAVRQVDLFVRFVYSVETSKHIFKLFSPCGIVSPRNYTAIFL